MKFENDKTISHKIIENALNLTQSEYGWIYFYNKFRNQIKGKYTKLFLFYDKTIDQRCIFIIEENGRINNFLKRVQ